MGTRGQKSCTLLLASAHLFRDVQHERVLHHLSRSDGLAQGSLGGLFKRGSRDVPARAVSSQPKQVRARELGHLEDAFHVYGLLGESKSHAEEGHVVNIRAKWRELVHRATMKDIANFGSTKATRTPAGE